MIMTATGPGGAAGPGGPEYEAAVRRAAELAALFSRHQAITEAELAASGIYPVSVVHGYAETDEDAELIYRA
jgi:hypothetical protein